jgi:hypothetical protein
MLECRSVDRQVNIWSGFVLTKSQQESLLLAMHQFIEETAESAASQLISGCPPTLNYPPNSGFTTAEGNALSRIPLVSGMESGLRKTIASAAALPLFRLLSILDGIEDPPFAAPGEAGRYWLGAKIEPNRCDDEAEATAERESLGLLHNQFYDSYWTWRDKRSDPGWKLDTHEG